MLHKHGKFGTDRPVPITDQGITADISDLFAFLLRNVYVITASISLGILLAILYLLLVPPRYSAVAQILIDSNNIRSARAGAPETLLDASTAESQVAMIRSGSIVRSVIDTLDLTKDTEFYDPSTNIIDTVKEFILGAQPPPTEEQKHLIAARELQRSLAVERVGISYVINIEYRSKDRSKAALIANTIASVYRTSQVKMRDESIQSTNAWLEERLAILRAETLAAEKLVQDLKAQTKDLNYGATLMDLESRAQLRRKVYESFSERQLETINQASSPDIEIRAITPATPPLDKSEPKRMLTLGGGTLAGLILGLAISFFRERIYSLTSSRLT